MLLELKQKINHEIKHISAITTKFIWASSQWDGPTPLVSMNQSQELHDDKDKEKHT